jgi:hypothetical protein
VAENDVTKEAVKAWDEYAPRFEKLLRDATGQDLDSGRKLALMCIYIDGYVDGARDRGPRIQDDPDRALGRYGKAVKACADDGECPSCFDVYYEQATPL